jgi:ribosome biogenesis protein BRX1
MEILIICKPVSLLVGSKTEEIQVDKVSKKKSKNVPEEEVEETEEVEEENEEDDEDDFELEPGQDATKVLLAKLRKQMQKDDTQVNKKFFNKQRVLLFAGRGTTQRYRHLMEDVRSLLPHNKKEPKFDTKESLSTINEICELKSCNNCIFFEMKKTDCFLWVSKTPNGPSAKFALSNSKYYQFESF